MQFGACRYEHRCCEYGKKHPGYTDPFGYLFGNILLISNADLLLLGILDIIVILIVWRFYPQIEATSFDERVCKGKRN